MGYISLFRKYRSESFGDLVGQDHIVKTISNFIASGKIPQGYLFCGTRGTGKTTVARIIAKALNCEHGPTPDPCCKCHACVSIREGNSVDVYEMDAASNRGVDDVEAIVESVKYRPSEFRYKVYIIDEAHQLSNQAKDAFLKTLEEPPEYAIFILATTEAHKIPVTIRSRCQQFDFRRGTIEAISGRIAHVAACENVSLTPEANLMIARAANGSYRDSLSILEQVISFSGNDISEKDVTGVLGLIEEDVLLGISGAVRRRDIASAFVYSEGLLSAGKDIKDAIPSVAAFFRDLLSVKIGADRTRGDKWQKEADAFDIRDLVRTIDVFVASEKSLRYTADARLVFELAFMKACSPDRGAETVREVRQAPAAAQPAENRPKKEPVRILQSGKPREEAKKPGPAAPVIDLDNIRKFWKKYLEYVRQNYGKVQLAKSAARARLNEYTNGTLYISFDHSDEFVCKMCNEEKKVLEEALANCYKSHINMVFDTEPAPVPREEVRETETVVPPTPDGLEPSGESGASQAAPAEKSYTIDNPRLAEEEQNPLTDPQYDDHPLVDEILELLPGSDVENIDK